MEVVLIDRTNHHLFQPLLYQVATAALAASDVSAPLRWLLRGQANASVLMAEVRSVDPRRRRVVLVEPAAAAGAGLGGARPSEAREVPYDYLILAAGSRPAYSGKDAEWAPLAPGLKTLEDALDVRRRFLSAFERAEMADDLDERNALLKFVVVGGGPTGVELAGVLPEIACNALRRDFRRINTALLTRVMLLEGGERILPAFPAELSERARRDLKRLGVDVRTRARVTRVEPDALYYVPASEWERAAGMGEDGEEWLRRREIRVETRSVFWAAGNAASPLARCLAEAADAAAREGGSSLDASGRVRVLPDLSVPGLPEVFVAGDAAAVTSPEGGGALPAVAPAAKQMGRHAARNILRDLSGAPREAFAYRDRGSLAVIGRNSAVADLPLPSLPSLPSLPGRRRGGGRGGGRGRRLRLAGRPTWWLWLFVHVLYLAGFRNRLSVLLHWAYAYFTWQRGVRLILPTSGRETQAPSRGPGAGRRQRRRRPAGGNAFATARTSRSPAGGEAVSSAGGEAVSSAAAAASSAAEGPTA